jgi:hypothetical protein
MELQTTPLMLIICSACNGNELDRNVRFEVFTAVTMKNGVFWDITPCGSCKSQEPGSSETSVLTRATRRNIPEGHHSSQIGMVKEIAED